MRCGSKVLATFSDLTVLRFLNKTSPARNFSEKAGKKWRLCSLRGEGCIDLKKRFVSMSE
jgi:hypothetical protein